MGQNNERYGAYLYDDVIDSLSYETQEERDRADRTEGLRRIRERSLAENVRFYTYKNFRNYGDGTFVPYQRPMQGYSFGNSIWEQIFIKGKSYFQYYALVEQTLWLLVLSCILCATRLRAENGHFWVHVKLVILGVSLYLLLFESASKYLYMFVPFYLLTASAGLHGFLAQADGRQTRD